MYVIIRIETNHFSWYEIIDTHTEPPCMCVNRKQCGQVKQDVHDCQQQQQMISWGTAN